MSSSTSISLLLELSCSRCGKKHNADSVQTVCSSCWGTLFCSYDIERAKETLTESALLRRPRSLWRYRETLPVRNDGNIVSLGEGYTPIVKLKRLGGRLGLSKLNAKDDGVIPTGTFKARGMTSAISRCLELGIKDVALASAGNAGSAAATYSARAGIECHVFMPKDAPDSTKKECLAVGAHLSLVDGLIGDAAKFVIEGRKKYGWFELSTLKEPYRVEGKKTMGYEIAEQRGWVDLPDVIAYPTGGGTGLIGMWKAFHEIKQLGLLKKSESMPRMVAVQSSGCAPVVKAFEGGRDSVETFSNARTIASGIRVPSPYASEQILRVLHESNGNAVEVEDDSILQCMRTLAKEEGLLACPEGAATLAGLEALFEDGEVDKSDDILLYITGSGLKYLELLA